MIPSISISKSLLLYMNLTIINLFPPPLPILFDPVFQYVNTSIKHMHVVKCYISIYNTRRLDQLKSTEGSII